MRQDEEETEGGPCYDATPVCCVSVDGEEEDRKRGLLLVDVW